MGFLLRLVQSRVVQFFIRVFCRVSQVIFRIVLSGVLGSKRSRIPPVTNQLLLESASSLAAKIRSKQVKSEDVVKAYINRIQEVQPIINGMTDERFVNAIEEARQVDLFLQNTDQPESTLAAEQPFLGVPFTSKQIIAVQGLALDAGLVRRKDEKAQMDAEVVTLMRKSGAIPLGVTNMPEVSMGFECGNVLYGRTLNPYDLAKTSGGSSGGECALITSAASILGIGNDLAGSLRIPALFCGIFAHKPTRGIVSNSRQYPALEKLNLQNYLCTGPLCRYAEDLLPTLRVMAGENASRLQLDKKVELSEIKMLYTEDENLLLFGSPIETEVKAGVKKVVDHFKKKYGIETEAISVPELKLAYYLWGIKSVKEQTRSLDQLLTAGKGLGVNVFIELFKVLFGTSRHTIQCLFYLLQSRIASCVPQDVFDAIESASAALEKHFRECLSGRCVFVCPTYPELFLYHTEQLTKSQNFALTAAHNITGFPVTQCPVGLSRKGYPLGVQVVANLHNDHLTLAVAREIELAFGGWNSPCRETSAADIV